LLRKLLSYSLWKLIYFTHNMLYQRVYITFCDSAGTIQVLHVSMGRVKYCIGFAQNSNNGNDHQSESHFQISTECILRDRRDIREPLHTYWRS
jgi:hypothetical protein